MRSEEVAGEVGKEVCGEKQKKKNDVKMKSM